MKKNKVVVLKQTIMDDWYGKLVDDLWELAQTKMIEFKHQIGKRILKDELKFGKPEYGSKKIENLANDLDIGKSDLYACIQFAKKYPELSDMSENYRTFTWRRIVHEYLPEHRDEDDSKDEHQETPPLPNKKYNVIYADPAWPVGTIEMDKWSSPLSDKYPTMTIDAIKNLSVPDLANDDCSLFLWTTHTFLQEALEIMNLWGFKYHVCITWDKKGGWSSNGFHRRTEFCLYGYKGRINVNQTGKFIPTLITEAKRKHSEKPLVMRNWIISNTKKPRIELFQRGKPLDKEFDNWGAEANGKTK